MKIQKITVQNFKAVSEQEIDLNGCSAIVTAGNNKGKSSMLSGLIDRFRGEIPDLIVKQGEEKGFNRIDLTDGSSIEWGFTQKTEKFVYTTKEGFEMKSGVLGQIGKKYFGIEFDIDKFLSSGPQAQTKQLQEIVGLDFSDVDARYKEAYEGRADANKEMKRVSGLGVEEPEKVDKPNLEKIKADIKEAEDNNAKIRTNWNAKNTKHREDTIDFNSNQITLDEKRDNMIDSYQFLLKFEDAWGECIDYEKAKKQLDDLPKGKDVRKVEDLEWPKMILTKELEQQLTNGNEQQRKYDAYERELKSYNDWVAEGKKARETAEKADTDVKAILSEKNEMIANSSLPEDFAIIDDTVHFKGFSLSNSQQSSSAKYIAALKLGSMSLGDIRTMHFDASFLDKNSLNDIQKWAETQDLQLLIERPDFDGGEIQYEIIQK